MRVHAIVPDELVDEVDARGGRRGRSRFLTEAVREKLARQRQETALRQMAGALAEADIPWWETPKATVEWVHAMRYGLDSVTEVAATATPVSSSQAKKGDGSLSH